MGGGRRGTCTHGEVGGTSRDVGGVGKHTGRWEGQACILGMGGAFLCSWFTIAMESWEKFSRNV